MSDNPFSEPDDSDRTVIRPAPAAAVRAAARGRQRRAPHSAPHRGRCRHRYPATARTRSASASTRWSRRRRRCCSCSVACATPTPARTRRAARAGHAADPRIRAGGARRAACRWSNSGPAHYALCASLDDVVLNTPWGSSGVWAARSLVSTFHRGGYAAASASSTCSTPAAGSIPAPTCRCWS